MDTDATAIGTHLGMPENGLDVELGGDVILTYATRVTTDMVECTADHMAATHRTTTVHATTTRATATTHGATVAHTATDATEHTLETADSAADTTADSKHTF